MSAPTAGTALPAAVAVETFGGREVVRLPKGDAAMLRQTLREREPLVLPTQLHVWLTEQVAVVEDVAPLREEPGVKPRGGLWTSTYDPRTGSSWVQWCLGESFRLPEGGLWRGALLTPVPARVYVVDTLADLVRLCHAYPRQPDPRWPGLAAIASVWHQPDWLQVAQDWDAVHLTEEGQWRTRLTHPYSLYGWDCESTLWFRWCFSGQEQVGPVAWTYGEGDSDHSDDDQADQASDDKEQAT